MRLIKSCFIALCLFVSSCSSSTVQGNLAPTSCNGPVCNVKVTPNTKKAVDEKVFVEGKTWKMEVPGTWHSEKLDVGPGERSTKVEAYIESNAEVGRGKMFASVLTIPWNKNERLFAESAAQSIVDRDDVKMVDGGMVDLNGHPASVILFDMEDALIGVQLAVASEKTGHIVRCGGDILQYKVVVPTCVKLVQSFTTKKSANVLVPGTVYVQK